MDMSKALPQPTVGLVLEKAEEFDRQNKVIEDAITELVAQFPENTHLAHVLLKVVAINSLYSTQILGVYAVAKEIHSRNIDARLNGGDHTLVNEIAWVEFGGKRRYNYSFATKYCSWHRRDLFPIYDRRVYCALRAYQKRNSFAAFKQEALLNYPTFYQIVREFRSYYGLETDFKTLDKFLYQVGGELSAS